MAILFHECGCSPIHKHRMVTYHLVSFVVQNLPPVRNSLDKKRKKKKKKVEKQSKPTSEDSRRINAYDFRAWDKYDVVGFV